MAAAQNGHVTRKDLEATSQALIEALSARKDLIIWAEKALTVYQLIKKVYQTYTSAPVPPEQVTELAQRVYQLEQYVTIDLERHIVIKNGRTPYYLQRVHTHLKKADDLLRTCINGNKYVINVGNVRELDHLAAEFQSTFNEYGFCQVVEAIYDVDEATQKLEALSLKLGKVEKSGDNNNADTSVALVELHDIIASQNGIQQAMTEANINRMKPKFNQIDQRINQIEESISAANIKSDSQLVLQYLACQHLLSKPFVKSVKKVDTSDVINDHMVHPGTRGWVFERFQRWLNKTEKRVFFIGGKEGCGKTAISSAICKLHSNATVASYFFDASKSADHNSLNSMLQCIASDLFTTVPEYLNWMDDKYSNEDLKARLADSWQSSYKLLLKEPLQGLYGAGGGGGGAGSQRRVLVLDGLDQLQPGEWEDCKQLLGMIKKDFPACICLFVTSRTDEFAKLVPVDYELTEGVGMEDKAWTNRHIKDIEVYLSTSLGAILSGEDKLDTPYRAKADESTLQNTVDELIKHSGGRFDYAIELMETFAAEMARSRGQFLSSLKKALAPIKEKHGDTMEENMREFSSPFRSYRDREGRSVDVRVMRQNHYLMDKTRVALIRGRHKIHELSK